MDSTSGVVVRKRVYLDDLDGYGMLHHSRYATFLDRAVIDYWQERGWRVDSRVAVQAIRELTVRFHAPVAAVGDIDIRFWVSSAGRTSVVYSFEFRSVDGAVRHADGTRVLVNLDPRTLTPLALSDEMWTMAEPLLGPGVEKPSV